MIKTDASTTNIVLMAGLAVGGLFILRRFAGDAVAAAGDAIGAAGQAINPVNNENIFARGVNRVGEEITGERGFSLGGFIFELLNDEPDPTAPVPDVTRNTPENPTNQVAMRDRNTLVLPSFESAFTRALRERGIGI